MSGCRGFLRPSTATRQQNANHACQPGSPSVPLLLASHASPRGAHAPTRKTPLERSTVWAVPPAASRLWCRALTSMLSNHRIRLRLCMRVFPTVILVAQAACPKDRMQAGCPLLCFSAFAYIFATWVLDSPARTSCACSSLLAAPVARLRGAAPGSGGAGLVASVRRCSLWYAVRGLTQSADNTTRRLDRARSARERFAVLLSSACRGKPASASMSAVSAGAVVKRWQDDDPRRVQLAQGLAYILPHSAWKAQSCVTRTVAQPEWPGAIKRRRWRPW